MGVWDSIKGAKEKHDQKKAAKRQAKEDYIALLVQSDFVYKLVARISAMAETPEFAWLKQGDSYDDDDTRILVCENDDFFLAAVHYEYRSYMKGEEKITVRETTASHNAKIMYYEIGYNPLETPLTLETSMEGVNLILIDTEIHELIENVVADELKKTFTDCSFEGRKTFRDKEGNWFTSTISASTYKVPKPARKGFFS